MSQAEQGADGSAGGQYDAALCRWQDGAFLFGKRETAVEWTEQDVVQLGQLRVRDLDGIGLELERVDPDEPRYIHIWRLSRRGSLDGYGGYIYAR